MANEELKRQERIAIDGDCVMCDRPIERIKKESKALRTT